MAATAQGAQKNAIAHFPRRFHRRAECSKAVPMQIFLCPFCGPREETEFHCVREPKVRTRPAEAFSDADWADYLYFNAYPRGASRELWLCLTCMESFAMTRDTATNAVLGSEPLRAAP